ncbi:MAG: D-2-hydroxyacid dehydrogenase [Eubacterium sp.]|nr:D-2-hydroxyacid dehydrogenase [Eubacterium sp.]
MKIVFLDAATIGSDIDLSGFEQLGEFVTYPASTPEEAKERARDADVILTNKVVIDEKSVGQAENLKFVCETATGTNNLDLDYLEKRGIGWCNAAGYSTEAVAQHTFSLLFYVLEHMRYFDDFVKSGEYTVSGNFTNVQKPYFEICGKTWGIIGLGTIGRRVAHIAEAFGAKVIYASASNRPPQEGYTQVSLEELYRESDIISVHAPLNEHTRGLINASAFDQMKESAIFLNLGRGPILVEKDLRDALEKGKIRAAGLDVLDVEPMAPDNPLAGYMDSDRLIITPHVAWASKEARIRLMDMILSQLTDWVKNR